MEAGLDEAGRGCLAGPVYAAAVILPKDYKHLKLDDSKKLTPRVREELRKEIEKEAIDFAVASVSNEEIDEINIYNASYKAMHLAIEKLSTPPQLLLVDGNKFIPYKKLPYHCVVKGDGIYYSIAAASVLAKTYRDEFMAKIHLEHPEYNWARNMGYGTKAHVRALMEYGRTPFHRKSFHVKAQLKMDL